MITRKQLGAVLTVAEKHGILDDWYEPMIAAMQRHSIDTTLRIAAFLGNVAVETGELQHIEENLHYSGDRLVQVFPGMFAHRPELAHELADKGPEAIANFIYDDDHRSVAYALGNTYPGAGWRNRGRGLMQLTGDSNYRAFFTHLGMDPESDRDLLLHPFYATASACHIWQAKSCNELADGSFFEQCVRRMNGGINGLEARQRYYQAFLGVMAASDVVA